MELGQLREAVSVIALGVDGLKACPQVLPALRNASEVRPSCVGKEAMWLFFGVIMKGWSITNVKDSCGVSLHRSWGSL